MFILTAIGKFLTSKIAGPLFGLTTLALGLYLAQQEISLRAVASELRTQVAGLTDDKVALTLNNGTLKANFDSCETLLQESTKRTDAALAIAEQKKKDFEAKDQSLAKSEALAKQLGDEIARRLPKPEQTVCEAAFEEGRHPNQ